MGSISSYLSTAVAVLVVSLIAAVVFYMDKSSRLSMKLTMAEVAVATQRANEAASDKATTRLKREMAELRRGYAASQRSLAKALLVNPAWADQQIPKGVKDALND
jgi:hypothetical protein